MDHEGRPVHGMLAVHDVPRVVDQDQVAHAHPAEAEPVRVDPEVIGIFGVADRDVPGDALAEPESPEDPQRTRQFLLPCSPLLTDVGEHRRGDLGDVLRCQDDTVDHLWARLMARRHRMFERRHVVSLSHQGNGLPGRVTTDMSSNMSLESSGNRCQTLPRGVPCTRVRTSATAPSIVTTSAAAASEPDDPPVAGS